jgi:hypothetical protein
MTHSYCFVGACPELTGPFVNYIRDHERDVTYDTLARQVRTADLLNFKWQAGYGRDTGLTMKNDWHISYHRSRTPSGQRVYFFVWSAMEYVFVPCSMRFNLERETELAEAAGF